MNSKQKKKNIKKHHIFKSEFLELTLIKIKNKLFIIQLMNVHQVQHQTC